MGMMTREQAREFASRWLPAWTGNDPERLAVRRRRRDPAGLENGGQQVVGHRVGPVGADAVPPPGEIEERHREPPRVRGATPR